MKYIMSGSNFYRSQEKIKRCIVNDAKRKRANEIALANRIEKKKSREFLHSFDIKHEKRQEMYYSWLWCKKKGYPINTFLQWEHEVDPQNATDAVKSVRSVAHHCLMFLQRNGRIPSHLLWSRMVPVGTNRELCTLICHIPENLYQEFKGYAQHWDKQSISVQQCSYDKEWSVDDTDKLVTVFDILCQATSRETQYKIKDVHTVESDIVYRPRVFHSEKLSKEDIEREFKIIQGINEIQRLGKVLNSAKSKTETETEK